MNFANKGLKYIAPKCKNLIISGFVSGFFIGCFPNKLAIKYQDKEYHSIPIPLLSGVIGSMAVIISPLLIVNYVLDGAYFDKLYDKYDIDVERYYQSDNICDKYAFPSLLRINIKDKPV